MSLTTIDDTGWILPEEKIEEILQAGLAEVYQLLQQQPERLLAMVYRGVTPDRRLQIRRFLETRDIRIVFGWPREEIETACWVITIDPETEEEFIGEQGGQVLDAEGNLVELRSARWRTGVAIVTWGENADAVRWLHHLSKWIVAYSRRAFVEAGFNELHLSSKDLSFDPRFVGAGRLVYRRALGINAAYHQTSIDLLAELSEITDTDTEADVVGSIADNFQPPA